MPVEWLDESFGTISRNRCITLLHGAFPTAAARQANFSEGEKEKEQNGYFIMIHPLLLLQ